MRNHWDLIQIVIPCFNGEEFLRETLFSIQNQTYANFDCLMIDDGSEDDSLKIFSDFSKSDPRFRVLQNSENRGESYSVNRGWANKRGNLVSILSCDDPQPNDWLEEMYLLYKRHSESNFIVYYPNRITIDPRGEVLKSEYLMDWNPRIISDDFICIPSVGAIIDSEKLPNGFIPRLSHVDYPSDLIQYLNIMRFGVGLRHPTFFCNWRLHSQNKSSLDRNLLANRLEFGILSYFNNLNLEMSLYQIISLTSQCHRLKTSEFRFAWISWLQWYKKLITGNEYSLVKIHFCLFNVSRRYFIRRLFRFLNSAR